MMSAVKTDIPLLPRGRANMSHSPSDLECACPRSTGCQACNGRKNGFGGGGGGGGVKDHAPFLKLCQTILDNGRTSLQMSLKLLHFKTAM